MKKITAIFILLLAGAACFGQDVNRINTLIKASLDKNFDAIQREAAEMDEVERLSVYNRNKIAPWEGGLINLFGPLVIGGIANFGVGNFIQGDMLGGGITLGGNLVGIGVLITGVVKFYLAPVAYARNGGGRDWPAYKDSLVLMGLGAGTTVLFNLFGTVKAFMYPSAYNNKLKRALEVEHMVLNIEPSIDISGQGVHLALARIQF
jgi:hypothetical protein